MHHDEHLMENFPEPKYWPDSWFKQIQDRLVGPICSAVVTRHSKVRRFLFKRIAQKKKLAKREKNPRRQAQAKQRQRDSRGRLLDGGLAEAVVTINEGSAVFVVQHSESNDTSEFACS